MTVLRISDTFSLPLDWMTLSTVCYGARGSGKTTFGRKVAEGAHAAGQRFCAIDLKGDWWGLKASADGQTAGIPVVIFGGDHADLPLEPEAGAFIAETVAGLHQSVVLDLEHLSKGKQLRFLAAFFDRLYDKNRQPLLLLMDESQRYAPQRPMSPEATVCLGAVEDLVKLGRKHGIGPVLFTQRGSGLNKEVSELCDMLVAFRTPGPLDQGRVKDWLEANATAEQAKEVMGQLAGLPTGTAVFASGHPDLKVFSVVTVQRPTTYDSSATPGVGKRLKVPKLLAKVDLDVLRTKMADAIERAQQDDPAVLRKVIRDNAVKAAKRIAELEAELRAPTTVEPMVVVEVETFPVLHPEDAQLLRDLNERLGDTRAMLARVEKKALGLPKDYVGHVALHNVLARARKRTERDEVADVGRRFEAMGHPSPIPVAKTTPAPEPTQEDGQLRAGARRMLDVLARHHPVRLTRAQLGTLTAMAHSGGTFSNYLSVMKRRGYVTENGRVLTIEPLGLFAAGVEPGNPMSAAEVREVWRSSLRAGARAMFDALVGAYPSGISREELGRMTDITHTGGTFGNYLSTLRRNGLVQVESNIVTATDVALGVVG